MTNPTDSADAFEVHCDYCTGTHIASLNVAPYGGTYAHGWLIYGVECDTANRRYGVTVHTNSRVNGN